MGFLTPKPSNEDERLPGAGLNLDADPHRCPSCRREVAPWEERCRDCGEVPVPAAELPGQQVDLPPGLQAMADDLDAELADQAGDDAITDGAITDETADGDGPGRDG